jgi:hypothetical protein
MEPDPERTASAKAIDAESDGVQQAQLANMTARCYSLLSLSRFLCRPPSSASTSHARRWGSCRDALE